MKTLSMVVLAGLIGVSGCGKSTDPTDGATLSFAIKPDAAAAPKSAAGPITVTDGAGLSIALTDVRLNVRQVQLDLPANAECDEDVSSDPRISCNSGTVTLTGPYLFDLTAGTVTPSIGTFTVPGGSYKRLDIRLDDTKAEDSLVTASDPLLDQTLLLKGTFDYDGVTGRNLSVLLKFNEDVRFEETGGVTVADGDEATLVLSLQIGQWLDSVDLVTSLDDGDLVLDTNGDLVIDDGGATGGIETQIKNTIKNRYDLKKE